jgi:acyl transferase domain-containing protein
MASRFAKAPDLHAYWSMCREGADGFSTIPPDRWPAELFLDEDPRAADMSYTPRGGFLEDIHSFPALALSIPPRRVEVMDPQQRLTLELTLEAIADAGLRTENLPRRTGVYIGATANEYRTLITSRMVSRMMSSWGLFLDHSLSS